MYSEDVDKLSKLKIRSDKLLENCKKNIEKNNKIPNTVNVVNNIILYDKFFDEGGVSGDVIVDRGSTFQTHAIKISVFEDINKYLSYLKTNNKIQKATHNILAYRYLEKKLNGNNKGTANTNTNSASMASGFDDDGEHGAGTRLLGILEKLKVFNVLVVVSRWFGGTLLGNDRFKHINDSAKGLLLSRKNLFEFQS